MAGGWYDIFLRGQTEVYEAIDDRGRSILRENQHMVLGPWTHDTLGTADPAGDLEVPDTAAYDLGDDLVFPWFDHWLKNEGGGLESKPSVRYYQMGDDEWRASDQWPPADAEATPYYLDSDGSANGRFGDGVLTSERPDSGAPTDTYDHDPLDPTPTRGGPTLGAVPAGAFDQASIEERDDVLVYTTEELDDPVAIAGDIRAILFVESTAPDTDFVVRLVDVDPDGYAANVTEGTLRVRYRNSLEEPKYMKSDSVYELEIDVRPVAHTFQAGHRIRLDVTSSNFPALDRNPNGTVPIAEATENDMQTATQTLYHDTEQPSKIVLPVTN